MSYLFFNLFCTLAIVWEAEQRPSMLQEVQLKTPAVNYSHFQIDCTTQRIPNAIITSNETVWESTPLINPLQSKPGERGGGVLLRYMELF
jgi:hypothetical protein